MRKLFSALAVCLAAGVLAQQPNTILPQPRLTIAFPPGAQAGTTLEVNLTGTDLEDPTAITFSHPGLTASIIVPEEPKVEPKPKEKEKDKEKEKEKQKEMVKKKASNATAAKLKVTVAKDVPAGTYDIRVANKYGISNPRAFVVSKRPEANETEPNNDVPEAKPMAMGSVMNGTISSPTDVDYFTFQGKAGQRVLVSCATSSIDSRAKPMVEVFSSNQKRLGSNRNYKDGDALVDITIPADGTYYIRVTEFAYQFGGPEFFYRLTLRDGPWVDAIFPPMIELGKSTQVTLYGRNLPGGKPSGYSIDGAAIQSLMVSITPPKGTPDLFRTSSRIDPVTGVLDSFDFTFPGADPVSVYLSQERVITEIEEGNDKPEKAQTLPVPCSVAGRIDKPYDRDWYSFPARKGEVLMLELLAERIGSGMDVVMTVLNSKGKTEIVGENSLDDDVDSLNPIGFPSRSTDPPAYKFVAPQDGLYLIRVTAREANVAFGPRCQYQLRIGPPKPGFRVFAMPKSKENPSALNIRMGSEAAVDVYAQRLDGFTGPITVTAMGLPKGITAAPATIGTGQKWGTLLLVATADAPETIAYLTLSATAKVGDTPVSVKVKPATMTWPIGNNQNIPAVTRLDSTMPLAVIAGKPDLKLEAPASKATVKSKDGKDEPVKGKIVVRPGDKISIPLKIIWQGEGARANPVQITMEPTVVPGNQQSPLSGNNQNNPVPIAKDKTDGVYTLDVRPQAVPGLYEVVLRADTQVPYGKDPTKGKTPVTMFAFTGPIAFTVLPTAVAKVTITAPPKALKPGETAEMLVRVERLLEYEGEYKISVAFPKESTFITAAPTVLATGQTEVKVKVTCAKDAKPGNVQNVVVTATGMYEGTYPIVQEAKTTITIGK